jgi:EAL domain-containing protein (putative c-di-GMP-specific phosphodiesterase class I)
MDVGLIRDVDSDAARQALVAGMVHFAGKTDCTLIGEGIETRAECDTLTELGVALGQGYLFGRPAGAPSARQMA